MPAKQYFNVPQADYAIHIGLTPNRSDANSHIGVARDVCAYLTHHSAERHYVQLPREIDTPGGKGEKIKVSIAEPAACPRYAGISLQHIKVGPSPEWLQQRLQTIGVQLSMSILDRH